MALGGDPGTGGDGGCGMAAGRLAAYVAGHLDDEHRRRVRDHTNGCEACRKAAASLDPSLLFLELRGAPLPGSFWTGFRARLHARLIQEPPPRWRFITLPRAAYLAAPLAMLLVLAGSLFVLRPQRHRWGRPAGGGRPPHQAPALPGPSGMPAAPGLRGAAGGAAAQGAPVIEEVGSAGARVYRFTVGGPGDETPIYLVVDEAIDI